MYNKLVRYKENIVALPLVVVTITVLFIFVNLVFTSCSDRADEFGLFNDESEQAYPEDDSVFNILMHYYNEDPDQAIIKAGDAEKEFLANNNYRALIRLYSFMSEVYQYRKSDDYLALEHIIKALDLVARYPDIQIDKTFLYINTGNILYRYGLFNEAVYIYREIPKISDAEYTPQIMALINNNIALSFQAQEMFDSARYYFNLSTKYIERTGRGRILLQIQNNNYLSSLALENGETLSVPDYYNNSQFLFWVFDHALKAWNSDYIDQYWEEISLDYYTNKIRSLNFMAKYYVSQDSSDNAIDLYREAYQLSISGGCCTRCADILYEMSEAYIMSEDYDIAINCLDSSLNLLKEEAANFQLISQVYFRKSEVYNILGSTSKEFECGEFSAMYQDSLISQKSSDEVVFKKIELAVKPVQLAMKNIELSRNEKIRTIERQTLFIKLLIFGVIFIAIAFFIVISLYRNLRKTQIELATRTIEKLKAANTAINEKQKLSDTIEQDLLLKFEEEIVTKKAFCESNLSLNSVAEKLDTNRSYISRIINSVYGMNFNDYINKLRIQEACVLICNNQNPNFTIDHLFSEVGFTGKSTFYSAFKKYTGVTPAVFFKMNNMTPGQVEN